MGRLREIRRVDSGDIERKIVTGAIVSTRFCQGVFRIYEPEYIRATYARQVMNWVRDYFHRYGEAPVQQIETIYAAEKESLKEADQELVESFLASISEEYERTEVFNHQYLLDQTVRYFKKRSLELLFGRGQALLLKNKVEEVEDQVQSYSKISQEMNQAIDPFSPEVVREILAGTDDDQMFGFPGALGEMIGKFRRDWLVGFMGPMKRGKTWWLQEVAVQALTNKFRVLFVSLEMNKETIIRRFYKRVLGIADKPGIYLCPVFDCIRNQMGECRRKERAGKISLIDTFTEEELDNLPSSYRKVEGYKACEACRGWGDRFKPAVWYVEVEQKRVKVKEIEKRLQAFSSMFGRNLKVVAFPAFTATVRDVAAEIDALEYEQGFVPDVVVIDYADILAPESWNLSERGNIDAIWKRLKGMAGERHMLVVTASQSNRGSIKKRTVDQTDTAEDIRKLAHVDVMVSLNQQPEERDQGIMRLCVIAHRHKAFSQNKQVQVLQQLELGQPFLDSEWAVEDS